MYLAIKKKGVVEVNLDKKGAAPLQMIPGDQTPGGFWMSYHIGASSRFLAVGAPLFALSWRRLDSSVRREESFEDVSDLDVQGNRMAVVGARRAADGKFSPDGAIAWIGSLDRDLADLKPLLFDARGPEAPNMAACGIMFLGATRFLADGSLLVVPSVQPGIYRFDLQGKLLQTLDTVALGIDTECASVGAELKATLARDFPRRLAWVNERRIVDDVLPLPAGPGLLVRSVQQGQVRWSLKVLRHDGNIAVYDVPVHAQTPFAHLKGDLRQGRLALLLWEYAPDGEPDGAPQPHLLIAAPPGS
ncbi:MAG TPA: hypothetical protein VFE25_08140 [Opitutaceae bacterium]|nr:hypothetical protein [Opitutaceae bacterium]